MIRERLTLTRVRPQPLGGTVIPGRHPGAFVALLHQGIVPVPHRIPRSVGGYGLGNLSTYPQEDIRGEGNQLRQRVTWTFWPCPPLPAMYPSSNLHHLPWSTCCHACYEAA